MAKVIEVIKRADVPKVVRGLRQAVEVAQAVNSTKVYNHKDKVAKALEGASTVLDVGYSLWRLFNK